MKRSGSRGRKRGVESAVRRLHHIRDERDPLARRDLPKGMRVIDPDLLPAADFTRPFRAVKAEAEVFTAFEAKRRGLSVEQVLALRESLTEEDTP